MLRASGRVSGGAHQGDRRGDLLGSLRGQAALAAGMGPQRPCLPPTLGSPDIFNCLLSDTMDIRLCYLLRKLVFPFKCTRSN